MRFVLALCLGALSTVSTFGCTASTETVCCPRAEGTCPSGGLRGGSAPNEAACEDITMLGFDGEFILRRDENGCEFWTESFFCPGGEMCCSVDER